MANFNPLTNAIGGAWATNPNTYYNVTPTNFGEYEYIYISEIVDNTIIFENDGLSVKTFKLVTRTKPIFTPELIAALLAIFGLIIYFVRQSVKKK